MKRPLFTTLIFLCFGIIVGMYFSYAHFLFAIFAVVISTTIAIYHKSKIPILFFIVFNIGYVGILTTITPVNQIIEDYIKNNKNFVIHGRVHSQNYTLNGRQRIHFQTDSFYVNGETIFESMRIQAILPHGESVSIGQNLQLIGRLNLLTQPTVPGGFDQFRFLRSRGIEYTMFPRNVVHGKTIVDLNSVLQELRRRITSVFNETLPPQQASIMQSMIMGDRSGMDLDLLDAFRASGLYHILVVSGIHMSILMIAVTWIFDKILPRKISGIVSLAIIVLYAFMIGGVSVYRASIMAGVVVFSRVLLRNRDFVTAISFAAMILLLYEPIFLFDAGFLLSFGSVFGIAIGSQPIERAVSRLFMIFPITRSFIKYKSFISGIAATLSVSFMIMPIFSWFFFRIMTYSVFANIVVMLTGNIIVILGFITGVVGLFSLSFARFLSGGLYFLANSYIWVAQTVYNLPRSLFWTGRPRLFTIVLYYFALFSFYAIFSEYRDKPSKTYKYSFFVFSIGFISLVISNFFGLFDRNVRITFLDIGRNSVMIVSAFGNNYIINKSNRPMNSVDNIQGYLNYRNIRTQDIIVVSSINFSYGLNYFDINKNRSLINGVDLRDITISGSLIIHPSQDSIHIIQIGG